MTLKMKVKVTVQHSLWCHSMANVNLYKSHIGAFFAISHRFQNIHISKFVTQNLGSGLQHSQWRHSMAATDSYLIAIVMFAFLQCLLIKIAT